LAPRTLLSEFPDGLQVEIARYCFSPVPEFRGTPQPSKFKATLLRVRETLFPGYRYAASRRMSPEISGSLRDWLRNRAATLFPDKQIIRVEFRWFRDSIRFDRGRTEFDREHTGIYAISIDEAGR